MPERPPHLLLNVDDDLASRYALSRILRHAGYEVIDAATAAEALTIVRARHPALVLLDVNLPDASGLDVSRQIKEDDVTADILVLHHSASSVLPADHARGLNRGADGYLTVPVENEVLLATVRSLLRIHDAERALRDSAQQWQSTFDAIADAVALLDADLRVSRCNRSFASWIGRDVETVVGSPFADLAPGLDAVPMPPRQGPSAPDGQRQSIELEHTGRWVLLTNDPVRRADGTLVGVVCVVSDIHDRKSVEHERRVLLERERLARREAETAARAKDEFLAVLSHELRTPLNAVLGWARMLKLRAVEPDRLAHAADAIDRNARAQAQLIEDLLDVSRAVSGHLRMNPAAVELTAVVKSAVDVVQMAAEAKGVILQVEAQGEPPRVLGDEVRLRQVVWNLLSNAIKFTPRGGQVSVTVGSSAGAAEITVRDTGIGLAPQTIPFVFGRFWQANEAAGRPSGLGLGLSIVRHIVESHGGVVSVESQGEGRGATFSVRIPLASDTALAGGVPANAGTQPLDVVARLPSTDER
jgi:PAS domain S-box-containing protein